LRKRGSSPVTIALFALAFTDLIFALDSIPAIFGLTKDPYIVFTANVFALMGLRQLYFLIGGLMKRLIYLTKGLSFILAFIGVKLIIEAFHGIDIHILFGIHIPEISTQFSLIVILATLTITAISSLVVSGKRGNNKVNNH
jgi:tellurite resistance protein TerC